MICKEALPLIHEYLDGDLQDAEVLELSRHLTECRHCTSRLKKLEIAESLVHSLQKTKASDDLTDRILRAIPAPSKKRSWRQWVRRHPAASVAAVFVVVMISSFLSLWDQERDLVVKGTDLDQVVINGSTVTVPAGHTVNGDLFVENGKIQVDGQVQGNLVVVDGSVNLASTASISGQITTIDQALDWIWYKVNHWFVSLAH